MNSDINMHLSDRVLHNANIGMWAIEIDEGAAPRMYGSETMLGLLGVTGQLTPEQLYHAWYDNIHPDHYDAVAIVVERMISGEHAEVQYPWNLHGEWIYVRCGGVRDMEYTKGVRLEGCHQDVSETVHIQKQRDRLIEEKQQKLLLQSISDDIIAEIGDSYESIYHVIPSKNSFVTIKRTDYLTDHYHDEEVPFDEAFRDYVRRDVHPDDREIMYRLTDPEYIAEQVKENPRMHVMFRDIHIGEPQFYEMRISRSRNYEESGGVTLCFVNRNESTELENKQRTIMQRNYDIIEILASEYTSVYYIDLTTDELTPYTMNEETENQFGVLFKNMTYSEAFRMYVDTLIVPEDKQMMLKAGSVGNIMKELRNKKTFLTTYRSDNGGDPHYCEMKFVKVGDEAGTPRAVALGFADKDEELRNNIEQETIRRRNTEIIEILASEYTSVYYIDMTTGELDPYTMNEELENEFGVIFRSGIQYYEAFKMYVNSLVFADDRDAMLRAGSIYNILEQLRDKKSFVTTYRSENGGDPHYCEMKFVKVGDDENPQAVALGFADKDEEIRKELNISSEREKNFEIIDILASEYSSVYYIDLNTDELTPYTMNDRTRAAFGEIFATGITYSEAFSIYVENAVAPESRAAMLKAGSISSIRRELMKQKSFVTTYLNEEMLYSEMKFVKVGGEKDEPQAVALGFSVVDEAYRHALEVKQHEAFINSLADDYEAVFYVNADENTVEAIRISDEYNMRYPAFTEGMSYTEYNAEVVKCLHEDERRAFIDTLKAENINARFNKEHAFFHDYSIVTGGERIYYQLKLIHTGNWEVDHNFLIGVHNMDKYTREQLEQSAALDKALTEAEAANVAKTTFLFNMSHDIRTPMNAIIGFTGMAQKHIDDRERVMDCLGKVQSSSEHLLSLINDVLDMSRIESGKIIIDEHPVDLRACHEDLVDIIAGGAADKGVEFVPTMDSSLKNTNIYADELRVNRVLINVLNNAIKYTNPGGKVLFTTSETDSDKPGYRRYRFRIEDNGIGMSREFMSHLFEAFAREQSSTVSGIQGTGLGLAITRELVELMGGKIDVESELGKGTVVTVTFDFRLADSLTSASASACANAELLAGKRILLVEDNELNREIARDILEEMGVVVDEAEDGTIAVQKCAENLSADPSQRYDCVLMDIQMPIMDGYKATGEIRNLPAAAQYHVPIIAMTANAFAEDKQRALEAGMDAHIAKPINTNELVRVLSKYCG